VNELVEDAFMIVIRRPSVCAVEPLAKSAIPVIPRKALVVAFTRIREAFPKLTLLARAVEVAKSAPALKATAPVTFSAARVLDAALICRVAFGVVVPIPISPLFLMNSPLEFVEDAENEANMPEVEVPIFRTANRPLVELSAVEEEVISKIVPPVREFALIFHPV
jgi:hypothetical protein